MLEVSAQALCAWRRQERIDREGVPGVSTAELAELVSAKHRIRESEVEIAIRRRASEIFVESGTSKKRFEAIWRVPVRFGRNVR